MSKYTGIIGRCLLGFGEDGRGSGGKLISVQVLATGEYSELSRNSSAELILGQHSHNSLSQNLKQEQKICYNV